MAKFGLDKKEDVFDCYRGDYVILYTNNQSFIGRLKEIDEGWLILQPHQGAEYDAEKGLIRNIIENKPRKVRKDDIIAIDPMTEKSVIAFCEYSNKHPEKNEKKMRLTNTIRKKQTKN